MTAEDELDTEKIRDITETTWLSGTQASVGNPVSMET